MAPASYRAENEVGRGKSGSLPSDWPSGRTGTRGAGGDAQQPLWSPMAELQRTNTAPAPARPPGSHPGPAGSDGRRRGAAPHPAPARREPRAPLRPPLPPSSVPLRRGAAGAAPLGAAPGTGARARRPRTHRRPGRAAAAALRRAARAMAGGRARCRETGGGAGQGRGLGPPLPGAVPGLLRAPRGLPARQEAARSPAAPGPSEPECEATGGSRPGEPGGSSGGRGEALFAAGTANKGCSS